MNKKTRTQIKQNNLSLRRRLLVYYYRFIISLRLLFLAFILVFLFTDLLAPIKHELKQKFYYISARYGFVIENLIIQGEENIPPKDIISALKADKGDSLFAVNIEDAQKTLENNPWVQAAIVERRLPNTIYIVVVERKPIAIWQYNQQLYLIDEEGKRISDQEISKFKGLLHVVGLDANIYASSLIKSLDKSPSIAKMVVSGVRYGQRRWDLNLQQGITIKMPEKDFDQAYDYLNSLDKAGKLFDQNHAVLDLRDASRYYLEKKLPNLEK